MKLLPRLGGVMMVAAFALVAGCSKAPERKPLFYQSPMHPWITSEQPGNCTICGMQLVPVYERSDPSEATPGDHLTVTQHTRESLGMQTAPAIRGPLVSEIRLSGILEDDETLHRVIAAFYEGRIEHVYVQQVGEQVKAGQPLAAIYSPELLYVVREYQNSVVRAKNDPVAINSRLRLIQFGLAPAQVDALAKRDREVYTIDILAPMDGTVLSRNAYQGQYVKNGELLFETGNLSRMWFQAEVYERDLAAIKLGQKAIVTSPAAPGQEFPGAVTFIDPSFNPETRSTKVRVEVENPANRESGGLKRALPHRAYAEATILTESAPVLSVPRSALLRDGRREVVFVETEPGRVVSRPVRAGRVTSDRAEIVEGLTDGDIVVAEGNLLLDAEAQLRFGTRVEASGRPLPEDLRNFLSWAADVSSALARDDLKAASAMAEHALHVAPKGAALPSSAPAGSTLAEFRETFLPWSTAAGALALQSRADGFDVPFFVMECPMTGAAFDGAPETARWVQSERSVQNPYLGKTMLSCGSEVAK